MIVMLVLWNRVRYADAGKVAQMDHGALRKDFLSYQQNLRVR